MGSAMHAHPCWSLALAPWLAIVVPGCVLDDIDVSDRRCPCTAGWVCDTARDRCVELLAWDAEVSMDAGGDAPADAGIQRPTCDTIEGVIFCEDFEGETFDRWTDVTGEDGGISRSATAARMGAQGLRILAPASARLTAAVDTGGATSVYFRAWVRVVTTPSAPIDLFELTTTGGGTVSAQIIPGGRYGVRVAAAGSEGASDESESSRWSVGAWRCVRVQVHRHDVDGSVSVLDLGGGPNAATLAHQDTDWGAPYDTFTIQIGPDVAEIELDDVMWTREPVACP